MKKLIISFVIIFILLIISGNCIAAPVVSTVTPTTTFTNGNVITISGTDFGATGPTVVLFDDMELGSNTTPMGDQVRNAQVGTWRDTSASCDPYYATYSNLQAHSGSLAMRQNWGSGAGEQEGARWNAPTFSGSFSQIYFSFWTYLPSGQNVPGTCCGIGANWKVWWLSTNDMFQNDYASEIVTDPPSETSLCYVDGSTSRGCCGYGGFTFTKGRWIRWEVYLFGSTTSSGEGYLWNTDSGNARHLTGSFSSDNTLDAGTTGWGYLHFPGFGRYDSNSNTYYDDIYVATGSGARARVEIGNNATYSSCTNLAVQTPTSWGSTSITATVRQGSFGASDTAYLFVVDSSGVASAGKAITFGSGGATPPLSTVTGLTITGGSVQ